MTMPRARLPVLAALLLLIGTLLPACASPARTGDPSPRPGNTAVQTPSSNLQKVDLAFCSQLMCVLPFEVAKRKGFFAAEGLDVNLIYMKGGPAAVNALHARSVDFISASMEAVVQAADQGRQMVLLNSTSHLPLFALVTAPNRADAIRSLADLRHKRIGVGNLGTADHALAQYLVSRQGLRPDAVEYVAVGPNIYQALKAGELDAAMVQEPALTLIVKEGGRELVNLMDTAQAERWLGGRYQHMGLVTRPDVISDRSDTARRLVRALGAANRFIHESGGAEISRYVPADLIPGGDVAALGPILDRTKRNLYAADGHAQHESVARVVEVLRSAGLVKNAERLAPDRLIDNRFVEGHR